MVEAFRVQDTDEQGTETGQAARLRVDALPARLDRNRAAATDTDIEVQPVLGRFALRYHLEPDPRPPAAGIGDAVRASAQLILSNFDNSDACQAVPRPACSPDPVVMRVGDYRGLQSPAFGHGRHVARARSVDASDATDKQVAEACGFTRIPRMTRALTSALTCQVSQVDMLDKTPSAYFAVFRYGIEYDLDMQLRYNCLLYPTPGQRGALAREEVNVRA